VEEFFLLLAFQQNFLSQKAYICHIMTNNNRDMGRRRKSGYQGDLRTPLVRSNPLNKLVDLHNAVAGNYVFSGKGTPLFYELVERQKKDCPHCLSSIYEEPALLICDYLNSDDVMKVLRCDRRTALDYLQTLRDIVKFYKRV
jgi:hypothetical protein